jgi:hypothetical protein
MANLYLQIQNGQPVNHPHLEENVLQVFGSIPSDWAPFKRVLSQDSGITLGLFQTYSHSYGLSSDNVTWQDVWTAVDMTDDEKSAYITNLQKYPAFPGAVLNTTTLIWEKPPKPNDGNSYIYDFENGAWKQVAPKPTDGQNYAYNTNTQQWVVTPVRPNDGKKYYFDWTNLVWVLLPTT